MQRTISFIFVGTVQEEMCIQLNLYWCLTFAWKSTVSTKFISPSQACWIRSKSCGWLIASRQVSWRFFSNLPMLGIVISSHYHWPTCCTFMTLYSHRRQIFFIFWRIDSTREFTDMHYLGSRSHIDRFSKFRFTYYWDYEVTVLLCRTNMIDSRSGKYVK